jgi:peptide-methionine (S)-S-oxide reductase
VGSQYRSAVFFRDERQRAEAERVRDSLVGAGTWPDPVVTVFEPASVFWPAEDYHQGYFLTHPVFCHARRK